MSKTPPGWTRTALRTHLGATYQTLHRLRGQMLDAAKDAPEQLGPTLQDIAEVLNEEARWLVSLQPVPESLRKSSRARFMRDYAARLDQTGDALQKAVVVPVDPVRFKPFGTALLVLLATQKRVREEVV